MSDIFYHSKILEILDSIPKNDSLKKLYVNTYISYPCIQKNIIILKKFGILTKKKNGRINNLILTSKGIDAIETYRKLKQIFNNDEITKIKNK